MAEFPLAIVKDIVKTGMAIKKAVETVRENKEECQDLLVVVATTIAVLSRHQSIGLRSHPATCIALRNLDRSLNRALKLVTECQKRTAMRSFLTAGDMAKQLRRVRDDIQLKMQLGHFAITAFVMEVTLEFTRTTNFQYDATCPPPIRLQDAAEMEIYSNHSTTGDARFEEDRARITTMVTTEAVAPFAPSSSNTASSGFTEFSLSETVATHHVSENINGGSGYTTITKVCMTTESCWRKAMKVAAAETGVISVTLVGKTDRFLIKGHGVDIARLTMRLRKKVAPAQLLQVSGDEDKDTTVVSAEEAWHKAADRGTRIRRSGFRAITARISRFMRPRARSRASPTLTSPVRVEDFTDVLELAAATGSPPADYSAQLQQRHRLQALEAPAMAEDDLFFAATTTTDPLLLQHQPAAPPLASVRRRRQTFNMSRIHRSVRLASARSKSRRMMPRTPPSSSSDRSGGRALQLLVWCALGTLVLLLLASIWWPYASCISIFHF